jgi:hypothetical protein
MLVKLNLEEYRQHCNNFDGICLDCGAWTAGGVESDAEGYVCDLCEAEAVCGCEQALITGQLEFVEG